MWSGLRSKRIKQPGSKDDSSKLNWKRKTQNLTIQAGLTRVEVTIPGVNKLGIACEKTSSTSGYTYNNLRLFHYQLNDLYRTYSAPCFVLFNPLPLCPPARSNLCSAVQPHHHSIAHSVRHV